MAIISRLDISQIRNLATVALNPSAKINVIIGANGSGKSSLLEALYLLGLGRSFRSTRVSPVIQYGSKSCAVYAQMEGGPSIGISKDKSGSTTIKLAGEKIQSIALVAAELPLQLLNSESFLLLEGNPKIRRKFIDWGVFHVEPLFQYSWKHAQLSLSNRNSLLRAEVLDRDQLAAWTAEFVRFSNVVDEHRLAYVESLVPIFLDTLASILPLNKLTLSYHRGWDKDISLEHVLAENVDKDKRYGFTQYGPQRADLKVKINNIKAVDVLSRGQQKLFVSALKISQGHLLSKMKGKKCIFLVDDLPAELDKDNRGLILNLLNNLECQVFLTCIDRETLDYSCSDSQETKSFHVEHGKIHSLRACK